MNDQIRNGYDVEDLVEVICNKMFFSDFVVRSPKYKKERGSDKEAADLLVPFKDNLIVFQVKSKIEFTQASEKSEINFKRIAKVVDEAIEQLKTIRRVLDNDWLGEIKTIKGFEIPFSPNDYKHVIGIVIIDLIGEEDFPRHERTRFISDYLFRFDIPIHIFMRDDFELLSTEIDTLPDFVQFLNTREQLFERGLIHIPIPILDFLAFYKTRPEILEKALLNNTHLYLENGIWDAYQEEFSSTIEQRNQLNKPSYLIDDIIDYLHTSVGFTAFDRVEKELGVPKRGGVSGYLTSAREITSLNRLERRLLGKKFLHSMQLADNKEYSFSLINLEKGSKAFLALSMNGDRSERQYWLHQLCSMAYCHLDLKQIIGIATEALNVPERSYDVYGLHGAVFENADELAKKAKQYFSEPYKPNITEYQGEIDDA